MQGKEHLVKLRFKLPKSDWHNYSVENMWAEPVGGNLFVLRNSPAYAYNVSFEDVVSADLKDGVLWFEKVVRRGGHSTYRIIVTDPNRISDFDEFWNPIEKLGCTYEGSTGPLRLYVVDVPRNVNIAKVYNLLSIGEEAGAWDFEEAHFGNELSAQSQQ